MDRISMLSDDLLLKILSYAGTKDLLNTSLLSKRWTSLWKHVTKLDLYVDLTANNRSLRFVKNLLKLHKAPVLETLHLTTYGARSVRQVYIERWVSVAISRNVRDFKFSKFYPSSWPVQLPRILYTWQSLVNLDLQNAKITDIPSDISFPSLKFLYLTYIHFYSDEVLSIMLFSCPVLEELRMCRSWDDDRVKIITIAVPWLQRLVISSAPSAYSRYLPNDIGFVVNTPSLKSLTTYVRISQFCSLVKMPELVKAKVHLMHSDPKFLSHVTSAKHLTLCLHPQTDYNPPDDFNQLVSLELCTRCSSYWLNHILRHSPNLRTLRFRQMYCGDTRDVQIKWEQPSFVPKCLISSLETVEWIVYERTEGEKEVAIYLLANASCLKKMTMKSSRFSNLEEKNRLLMEFESKPRSSSKCLINLVSL